MSAAIPMHFKWTGEAMVPLHPKLADAYFVVEEIYKLEVIEDRSGASHRFYFVCLNEAHKNLSEELAQRFPTMDHLRKWALIRSGHRDEKSFVCNSRAEALRFAAFLRPMDDFSVVITSESAVTVFTAKSQSMRSQGKKAFEESKSAVLDIVSALIGTDRETLTANAEKAA